MNCNCLCKVIHPSNLGICRGTADERVPFYSERTGHIEVQMCAACATEARKKKKRRPA